MEKLVCLDLLKFFSQLYFVLFCVETIKNRKRWEYILKFMSRVEFGNVPGP